MRYIEITTTRLLMQSPKAGQHKEDLELITNYDLTAVAHGALGGIQRSAPQPWHKSVEAEEFFTPSDDGLNEQQWFGGCTCSHLQVPTSGTKRKTAGRRPGPAAPRWCHPCCVVQAVAFMDERR